MKDKLTVWLISVCLFAGLALMPALPDAAISKSERRLLKQLPELKLSAVMDGSWMSAIEGYLLDQFPERDALRGVKAWILFNIMRQSDKGGLYIGESGHIFKPAYPMSAASLEGFAKKLNEVHEGYLGDSRVFWAVIPDKAHYEALAHSRLLIPYEEQLALVSSHLNADIGFIPLYDRLELNCYYRTDLHWRQEALTPIVERLGEYLDFEMPRQTMSAHTYSPFYGAYYGQSALSVQPDTLVYLTSPLTQSAELIDLERPELKAVYYTQGLSGMDSYDVFLNGAAPLITIKNAQSQTGRELIIFRDSFTSSLAPLLLGAYESITLIDLRYIASGLLGEYVSFEGRDVLFLYGEQVLNSSAMLK